MRPGRVVYLHHRVEPVTEGGAGGRLELGQRDAGDLEVVEVREVAVQVLPCW